MIEKSNCPLSLEEARIVADLFRQNRLNTKTDISKEVEFFPIIGDDGTVLMHVFNYGKNNGFVIVGTSKAYMPILAYCDTGNFSTNYKDTGVCVWIDEQKSLISYYEEKARNGFNRFEAMWKQFEATILQPQTKDIMDARRELIMWAQNNGYDIYTLPERPNYLPDSDYSRFCTSAQTNCHPDYDYWEDSIILGIESHTNTSTGNLLTTTWGQRNHYNDAIKNGPNNNPYLGCTTVAMGQIMKYHMYPNDYSWSLMADNYATNATAVLLGNIHNRINWFLTNGTSDPISAKNAFVEYGYSNATLISHDHNRVCTEMNARRPVLMSGASGISGHSWVCCGKHSISNTYTYHLYTLSEIPPLHYERVDTYFGSDGMTYLYMNWGWEGLYDGWYFSDNANPGSDNFNWARSEIVNISY